MGHFLFITQYKKYFRVINKYFKYFYILLTLFILKYISIYLKEKTMKKILLLPLLVLGLANAAEETNTTKAPTATHATNVQTMQKLEQGMSTIQKGLMYNNEGMVKQGVEEIKKNTKDIDSFDIKNKENSSFKAKKYSETEAKAIAELADKMIKAFDRHDKNRVLDTYRRLQDRCITCHTLIRKW